MSEEITEESSQPEPQAKNGFIQKAARYIAPAVVALASLLPARAAQAETPHTDATHTVADIPIDNAAMTRLDQIVTSAHVRAGADTPEAVALDAAKRYETDHLAIRDKAHTDAAMTHAGVVAHQAIEDMHKVSMPHLDEVHKAALFVAMAYNDPAVSHAAPNAAQAHAQEAHAPAQGVAEPIVALVDYLVVQAHDNGAHGAKNVAAQVALGYEQHRGSKAVTEENIVSLAFQDVERAKHSADEAMQELPEARKLPSVKGAHMDDEHIVAALVATHYAPNMEQQLAQLVQSHEGQHAAAGLEHAGDHSEPGQHPAKADHGHSRPGSGHKR